MTASACIRVTYKTALNALGSDAMTSTDLTLAVCAVKEESKALLTTSQRRTLISPEAVSLGGERKGGEEGGRGMNKEK